MNLELIEPALTELLQTNRDLKAELLEQKKLLQKLLERNGNALGAEALKELFRIETERLKLEARESSLQESKSWVLFSNDFQAQNFKVVVETVCKWAAIICGSFYLIHSLLSLLKKG